MARPPLSELHVTRRPTQRFYAVLWVASCVPWIIAAAVEGDVGFVVVAIVWCVIAAFSVADLWSRARIHQGQLTVRRLGRERVVGLAGARLKARRREIALIDVHDDVVFRLYPDRDQVAIGQDPRPIGLAEVTEELHARIDEAEAQGHQP